MISPTRSTHAHFLDAVTKAYEAWENGNLPSPSAADVIQWGCDALDIDVVEHQAVADAAVDVFARAGEWGMTLDQQVRIALVALEPIVPDDLLLDIVGPDKMADGDRVYDLTMDVSFPAPDDAKANALVWALMGAMGQHVGAEVRLDPAFLSETFDDLDKDSRDVCDY